VTVEVAVPQRLSEEAREALQAFAAAQPENPRAHLSAMTRTNAAHTSGGEK